MKAPRRPSRPAGCPSEFALERHRQGELAGTPDGDRLDAHLSGCTRCRALRSELAAAVAPPVRWDEALSGSDAPSAAARWWRRPSFWRTGGPLLPCAAAGMVLLAMRVRPWGEPPSTERTKGRGGWELGLVVRHADGRTEAVSSGAALAPGERIRFSVAGPEDAFVAVVSIDGRGRVTPFLPTAGEPPRVRAGQRRLFTDAIELDDAPGPERLLLMACSKARSVQEIVEAARKALRSAGEDVRRLPPLALPCVETTFWVEKIGSR